MKYNYCVIIRNLFLLDPLEFSFITKIFKEDYLQSPFAQLFRSVSVLFIDDEPRQLQFYKDMIGEHPLYSVLTVSCTRQAQEIIHSNKTVHLCVLDLGIDDIESDEFYLLKKFGLKVPVIIISGSMDIERAFEASGYGAAGMISKPPDVLSLKFWDTLANVFCNRTILPVFSSSVNPVLKEICKAVCSTLPESVAEWASKANISDTYLRKLWSECFTFSPKYMLALYKIYYYAFRYHNSLYLSEISNREPPILSDIEIALYRRLVNYYMQNKRECDRVRDKWV